MLGILNASIGQHLVQRHGDIRRRQRRRTERCAACGVPARTPETRGKSGGDHLIQSNGLPRKPGRFTTVGKKIRWTDKARPNFKHGVKKLTERNWGVSMEYRLHKLNQYLRGRFGYFGISQYDRSRNWTNGCARACATGKSGVGHAPICGIC